MFLWAIESNYYSNPKNMQQICTTWMAMLFAASTKKITQFIIVLAVALPSFSWAQPGNNNSPKVIPELVFQNPVLVSGTDKKEGAAYLFKNVATGVDALMEIKKVSDKSTVINTIDVTQVGWNKAFQPEVGRTGNVAPYQNWWVRFHISFLQAGTDKKMVLTQFYVTTLDVDGDGLSIREFVQMQKADSIKFSKVTYLGLASPIDCGLPNSTKDKLTQGPVQNFTDIDTVSTSVMATYVYMNTSEFDFTLGAKSNAAVSPAGLRLNSLWFKSFSLAPQKALPTLPLQLINFQGNINDNKVGLQWTVAENETGNSFELEKGFDGVHFTTAALIFTTTKAGEENYSYKESIEQTSFYRLKMINKDNSVSYSKTIRVAVEKSESSNQVRILQNPVTASLQFSYSAPSNESTTVNIYTLTGTKLFSTRLPSQKGTNTQLLNLNSKINPGVYLLEIINGTERSISKFMKQ
jgi:hypothetical protein